MSEYDTARWRGAVDATLGDHERRLEAINGHVAATATALQDVRVEMATTRARVALMAGLAAGVASILGSAIAMGIIYAYAGG